MRGVEDSSELTGFGSDFSENGGEATMQTILKCRRPDAVIVTDDYIAFGVIKALAEAGVNDIAVVGFNNTLRGRYQSPTLTSTSILLSSVPAPRGCPGDKKPGEPVSGFEIQILNKFIS